jgi:hypothetical protein
MTNSVTQTGESIEAQLKGGRPKRGKPKKVKLAKQKFARQKIPRAASGKRCYLSPSVANRTQAM